MLLTTTADCVPPQTHQPESKCAQCWCMPRHCVVLKVASDDELQPLAGASQRLVHALPQLPLDGLELGAHLLSRCFPPDDKADSIPGFPTGMREPQEIERLRLALDRKSTRL